MCARGLERQHECNRRGLKHGRPEDWSGLEGAGRQRARVRDRADRAVVTRRLGMNVRRLNRRHKDHEEHTQHGERLLKPGSSSMKLCDHGSVCSVSRWSDSIVLRSRFARSKGPWTARRRASRSRRTSTQGASETSTRGTPLIVNWMHLPCRSLPELELETEELA